MVSKKELMKKIVVKFKNRTSNLRGVNITLPRGLFLDPKAYREYSYCQGNVDSRTGIKNEFRIVPISEFDEQKELDLIRKLIISEKELNKLREQYQEERNKRDNVKIIKGL